MPGVSLAPLPALWTHSAPDARSPAGASIGAGQRAPGVSLAPLPTLWTHGAPDVRSPAGASIGAGQRAPGVSPAPLPTLWTHGAPDVRSPAGASIGAEQRAPGVSPAPLPAHVLRGGSPGVGLGAPALGAHGLVAPQLPGARVTEHRLSSLSGAIGQQVYAANAAQGVPAAGMPWHGDAVAFIVDQHVGTERAAPLLATLQRVADAARALPPEAQALRARLEALIGVAMAAQSTRDAHAIVRGEVALVAALAWADKLAAALEWPAIQRQAFRVANPTVTARSPAAAAAAAEAEAMPMAQWAAKYGREGELHGVLAATMRANARRRTAALVTGSPSDERPVSTDPAGMVAACPLYAGGAVDDECRRKLAYPAPVHVPQHHIDEGLLGELPPEAREAIRREPLRPHINAVRLRERHVATCTPCDGQRQCYIDKLVMVATQLPEFFYPGQRPRAQYRDARPDEPAPRDYDNEPEEERLQRLESLCESMAAGAIEPIPPRLETQEDGSVRAIEQVPCIVAKTFVAYRTRTATVEGAALAFAGAAAEVRARFQEAGRKLWAAAEARVGGGTPDVPALMRALADASVEREPRVVFNYKPLNRRGVPWPYSQAVLADLLVSVQPGDFIASDDLRKFFTVVVLHPDSRGYRAICAGGRYWQPTRMFFGERIGPPVGCMLSGEIARIAKAECEQAGLVVRALWPFVDDLFQVTPDEATGNAVQDKLGELAEYVGAPTKRAKRRPPAQRGIDLLGLVGDTLDMTLELPLQKRHKYTTLLAYLLEAIAHDALFPSELLHKMAGQLMHCVFVYWHMARHLQPFWRAVETDGSSVRVRAVRGLAAAARAWFLVLTDPLCAHAQLIPSPSAPFSAPWVTTRSDASGDVGAAITLGNVTIWLPWKPGFTVADASIQALEAWPVLALATLAGDLLAGMGWRELTDNLALVFAALKGYTSDGALEPVLGAVLALQERHAFLLLPSWLPREFNEFMDRVSKATSRDEVRRAVEEFLRSD